MWETGEGEAVYNTPGSRIQNPEEGLYQKGGGEAGGGEERSLEGPRAGQGSDEGRVCLHCVKLSFIHFTFKNKQKLAFIM